jgi:hypothetical protein
VRTCRLVFTESVKSSGQRKSERNERRKTIIDGRAASTDLIPSILHLDLSAQAEFAEGGACFFELLFRDAALGGRLERDFKFDALGCREFGDDFGVEVHPFLRRDFSGP